MVARYGMVMVADAAARSCCSLLFSLEFGKMAGDEDTEDTAGNAHMKNQYLRHIQTPT